MSGIRCPDPLCNHPVPTDDVPTGQALTCPRCGRAVPPTADLPPTVEVFPPEAQATAATAEDTPPSPAPPPPDRLGRFEVRERLGEGAFGVVYRAYDPHLEREVALKVAKPDHLVNELLVKRFLREARATAGLRHPHIVPVFEAGQDGGYYYIASALIPGRSLAGELADLPAGRGLEARRAARLTLKVAEALAYAHKQGVVHRDVKPGNVVLDEHGEPLLVDFGLAVRVKGDEKLTGKGVVLGTPAYMAPEQADGAAGPASDQYSLGCTLYELLTRQTPFAGPPELQLLLHRTQEPPPPRTLRPDLPAELEEVCLTCLDKRATHRHPDCGALADELRRWLDGKPGLRRPLPPDHRQPAPLPPRPGDEPTPAEVTPPHQGLSSVRAGRKWLIVGSVLITLLLGGLVAALLTTGTVTLLPRFRVPPDTVERAYLSDMKPFEQVDWPAHDMLPGMPRPPNFFERMSVQDRPVPHGLGMLGSPRGPVSVSYALDRRYDVFVAGVALNDSSHGAFSAMTFRVYGDGKELWRSRPVQRAGDADQCRVSVKGVDVLKLELTCDGEILGTHGLWVEPYVERQGAPQKGGGGQPGN